VGRRIEDRDGKKDAKSSSIEPTPAFMTEPLTTSL
jgi:hypothetical protein